MVASAAGGYPPRRAAPNTLLVTSVNAVLITKIGCPSRGSPSSAFQAPGRHVWSRDLAMVTACGRDSTEVTVCSRDSTLVSETLRRGHERRSGHVPTCSGAKRRATERQAACHGGARLAVVYAELHSRGLTAGDRSRRFAAGDSINRYSAQGIYSMRPGPAVDAGRSACGPGRNEALETWGCTGAKNPTATRSLRRPESQSLGQHVTRAVNGQPAS